MIFIKDVFHEPIFGVHRLKLIQHGSLLRITSETILSQMIETIAILIHTIQQNLNKLLKEHSKKLQITKKEKHKDLYQIPIVIDDFADDTNFTRKSQLLHQLYIRGRHYMISTTTSAQVYK